ncbi:MAG: diguanylate cyclase [Proteobacteria bacterium]|nr:diguanylate cyclase [Pseudomonadota bacterium]
MFLGISRKIFLAVVVLVAAYAAALYLLAAGPVQREVWQARSLAMDRILAAVDEMAGTGRRTMEEEAAVYHERQEDLKAVVGLAERLLVCLARMAAEGLITAQEAREQAVSEIIAMRWGNGDYLWAVDYQSRMKAHPNPALAGKDFSKIRDEEGNLIIPPLVEAARQNPEGGFHSYRFPRLDGGPPREKISYARDFPAWGWVIGAGVYVDDLREDAVQAQAQALDRLDQTLDGMTPARTGQIFLFSADGRIQAPASARDAVEPALKAVNPATGNLLVQDLIQAADTRETFFLSYPNEGRRAAWARRLAGEGGYAAVWMDADEVEGSLRTLGWAIGLLFAVLACMILYLAWLSIGRFLAPIRRLSQVAMEVEMGDLEASCELGGNDEIGRLSGTFNSMVAKLKENIRDLDQKVRERTAELGEKNQSLVEENEKRRAAEAELAAANERLRRWVDELKGNNDRMERLNQFSDRLQAAESREEAVDLTSGAVRDLFFSEAGGLYMEDNSRTRYKAVAWWGPGGRPPDLATEDCECLKTGTAHLAVPGEEGEICAHVRPGPDEASLCAPLVARGQVLGMLHLRFSQSQERFTPGQAVRRLESLPHLATAVADQAALALANIRLRERLKELSVRDPLTGLFNRRYMEETLDREADKARREAGSLGVIMLDVDLFKAFNDTHGHEAGDFLLRKLGLLLQKSVRHGDVACRYGGEEFLLILPGANLADACARAEDIRARVERELHIQVGEETPGATVSAGAAVFPDHGDDPPRVIAAADAAMYRAKAQGRNRVSWA